MENYEDVKGNIALYILAQKRLKAKLPWTKDIYTAAFITTAKCMEKSGTLTYYLFYDEMVKLAGKGDFKEILKRLRDGPKI